jgi:hypothetical protein
MGLQKKDVRIKNYPKNFVTIFHRLLEDNLLDPGPRVPWRAVGANTPENANPTYDDDWDSYFNPTGKKKKYTAEKEEVTVEKIILGHIAKGAPHLPQAYRKAFLEPLESNLKSLITRYDGFYDTLVGAIFDHTDETVNKDLDRFLAVISNLFRSFVSAQRHKDLGFPPVLADILPPLATFKSGIIPYPHTFPSDEIQTMCGGTVGIVYLPYGYRNHPVLWGVLAHETGGHDVVGADKDLLPELQQGLYDLFAKGRGWFHNGKSGEIKPKDLGNLWRYWTEEAASDAYGVLNMGPAFTFNMAIQLVTITQQFRLTLLFHARLQRAMGQGLSRREIRDLDNRIDDLEKTVAKNRKNPTLRAWSGRKEAMEERLDPHPVDLLRLHLLKGVVQNLFELDYEVREVYCQHIDELAKMCAGGVKEVEIHGHIQVGLDRWETLNEVWPLEEMQESARIVGAYLVTEKFQRFNGYSIQDLETWDDQDEGRAQVISDALCLRGNNVDSLGDDAQLLAGATVAMFKKPSFYASISSRLKSALDKSYDRDYYWGLTGIQ